MSIPRISWGSSILYSGNVGPSAAEGSPGTSGALGGSAFSTAFWRLLSTCEKISVWVGLVILLAPAQLYRINIGAERHFPHPASKASHASLAAFALLIFSTIANRPRT